MRQKHEAKPGSAEKTIRDIRRATRRRHSSEEKIRIALEGLRGEDSIAGYSSLDSTTPDKAYFTPLPLRLAA